MKSTPTKIMYSTLIAASLIFCSSSIRAQNVEDEIIAELVSCISNFQDKRTYVQFIDAMITKVNANKDSLVAYFAQNHPNLTVDGFSKALQAARKATNALSAGNALKNYYELLPKNITLSALMLGINKRMKEDFKKN